MKQLMSTDALVFVSAGELDVLIRGMRDSKEKVQGHLSSIHEEYAPAVYDYWSEELRRIDAVLTDLETIRKELPF